MAFKRRECVEWMRMSGPGPYLGPFVKVSARDRHFFHALQMHKCIKKNLLLLNYRVRKFKKLGQDSDIAYRKDREKISLESSTVIERETGIPELLDDGFFWQQ
jgi:hypothetical protein